VALIKAAEYACLGLLVGWVGRRKQGGAWAHVTAGLAVGLLFGGAILVLTVRGAPKPLPPLALASRALNEIVFPAGCALVLFAAEALGRKLGER
jgi:hypothetical protein